MTPAEQAAVDAAEGIRALNRATINRAGYEWPSEVDHVVASLEMVTARLPQALQQASRWLTRALDAGELRHDDGDSADLQVSVVEALGDLRRAAGQAEHLALTLSSVRDNTNHLAGVE